MPVLLEQVLAWLGPYLAKALIAALKGSPDLRSQLKSAMDLLDKAETDEELGDAAKALQDTIRS